MNMTMIRYASIPTLSEWKKDSNVRDIRVTRKSDPVLSRVDNIIEAIGKSKDDAEALYLRFELFFATNYWLSAFKNQHTMIRMRPEREPAMWALFRCNAQALADGFGVGIQALANTLELHFGRTLSEHGRQMDQKSYHYFRSQAEREKFKLFYKNGRVHQLPWRDIFSGKHALSEVKPVPANSSLIHDQTSGSLQGTLDTGYKGEQRELEGWAFFVMSMSRELYMTPHVNVKSAKSSYASKVSEYHSSIFAGMPVACAGTICIQNGFIKGIQNDSGHYQPTNLHLLSALQQFSMMGVPMKGITVYDYAGAVRSSGEEFLANFGNWKSVRERKIRNNPEMRQWEIEVKLKYGKTGNENTFRELVQERYQSLATILPHHTQEQRWERAHREVALALGEERKEYWKKAAAEPIPFAPPAPTATGPAPRPKPAVPGKQNRPRFIRT